MGMVTIQTLKLVQMFDRKVAQRFELVQCAHLTGFG